MLFTELINIRNGETWINYQSSRNSIYRQIWLSFSHLWFNPTPHHPSNLCKTAGFRKGNKHYLSALFCSPWNRCREIKWFSQIAQFRMSISDIYVSGFGILEWPIVLQNPIQLAQSFERKKCETLEWKAKWECGPFSEEIQEKARNFIILWCSPP